MTDPNANPSPGQDPPLGGYRRWPRGPVLIAADAARMNAALAETPPPLDTDADDDTDEDQP
ncbi:MAG TPA: hypothetical protein VNC78_06150 [Actinomycetota bacterium]|nr:hypothetical protein [Actinomycetota bacterium]